MSEPTRYDYEQSELNKSAGFYVRNKGHWVKWEDYARLKAEVENSKRINTELLALSNRQASDIRRLTKAGDDIYQSFDQFGQVDATTLKGWQAAKGVKP